MTVSIPSTGTEFTANRLIFLRGSVLDITSVGMFHTPVASYTPEVSEFTPALLIVPPHPLAESTWVDMLLLIGPRGEITLAPGVYQKWGLVTTVTEDIIRRIDTVEII